MCLFHACAAGQAGARASLLVSGQLQLSLGQQWGHVAQVVLCREGHTGQVTCCAGDAFTVQVRKWYHAGFFLSHHPHVLAAVALKLFT